MYILLIIIGASWLVVGCQSKKSSTAFDNYLYRLSNSLDVEQDFDEPFPPLTAYPKKSALLHPIPELNISLLKFLQLSKCDLQRLIGQRNSSLGKFMTGYHTLLYEHEFFTLAIRCQQTMLKNDPLYTDLDRAIAHKRNNRNKLYWNAIFAGDEVRHLFSLGSRVLTLQELSGSPVELINALETLQMWLSDPATSPQQLQQAYEILAFRKYIGELRLTIAMATARLVQADRLISQRLAQRPLCQNQRGNRKFDVVERVFYRFYIGEVQPLLSTLHRQGQTLLGLIDQLQSSLEPNQEFTEFWSNVYRSKNSEWRRFDAAIATHTLAWQNLLRQCGALPSRPSGPSS